MFSIIIPTLLKTKSVLDMLISELNEDKKVGEIILINNSSDEYSHVAEKLRIIKPETNLYVNPSWNLGVENAKYDYIGILNDDLLLPKDFCSDIFKFVENDEKCGLIGIDNSILTVTDLNDFGEYPSKKDYQLEPLKDNLSIGYWGAGFFGKKENYYPIPNEIKILCGDNYLLLKNFENKKENYKILNCNVKHVGSLSQGTEVLTGIKKEDAELYQNIDSAYKKRCMPRENFLEKIFSLKNEYARNCKYKVINILGITLRIKLK